MLEKLGRIRLLYIVLGVLLLVGLLPLAFAGFLLSSRSADELRSIEGRYQAQLVQDKARQIELYGQRYRDVVTGLARAFEISGGIKALNDQGYDQRLQKTLQEDPNLIALALWPVDGTLHRAFQPDVIKLEEVDARVSEVLARMSGRGVVVSRPQVIRSGQEMALTIAEPVLGGRNNQDVVAAVVAIQDEAAALASVSDMRWQTLWISFIASLLTILIGIFFARKLTHPVQDLASGAHRIASGDFSKRIEVTSRTELGDLGNSFNIMTDQIERFIGDLQRSAQENRELFIGTVKGLAAAIDGKDPYTRGHSERVSRFSMAIAQRLGLPDDEIEKIRISALLHDVGKIAIDDNILKKPAALTDEEYEIMKKHPQKGYKIMSQIPAMKEFLPGMYMHHEMVNGKGYPQGLKGDEIPLMGKIVAVADTFDAVTTDRPDQQAMTFEDALNRIKSFVGTRYDPAVVAAFSEACKEGQIRPGQVKLRKPSASKPELVGVA